MIINGIGALATGLTVLVVIVAKFSEGAWITVIAIPSLLALMFGVNRHYRKVWREIESNTPLNMADEPKPLLVVVMTGWNRIGKEALRFAMTLSPDIKVLHVAEEDKPVFAGRWLECVEEPLTEAGSPVPELVILRSPYRFVVTPIVDYVLKLAKDNPGRRVVTVIPELMEKRWYYYFLHTQRATLLKTSLLMQGNDHISVLNIPWYLKTK